VDPAGVVHWKVPGRDWVSWPAGELLEDVVGVAQAAVQAIITHF
jgi:hypothetical protein